MLLGVILLNVASVAGAALSSIGATALPGDFELTEIGCAVAAFSFLPYCQIRGLNVTADIFTARASKFWIAVFAFFSAVVALIFACILLWRMWAGMLDQKEYDYTTAILLIPVWWAFVPCVASLALLAFTSLATLLDVGGRLRRGG